MLRTFIRTGVVAAAIAGLAATITAQQVPDRDFRPAVESPAFAEGRGPVVCVDEAHANFHTLGDRFWAFGELVRRDGFVVRPNTAPFATASLDACRILVISNAQPSAAEWNTYPYPTPPAFTADEIKATVQWVRAGGALLLIADHMPLAGAAAPLAAAFDVTFTDGFAMEGFAQEADRNAAMARPTIFRTADGTLASHAIVRGRSAKESVSSVRSFTGQAFKAPAGAEPILILPPTFVVLLPERAWQFGPDTRRIDVGGWLQGAVMRAGAGRAAFFGEAAMLARNWPDRRGSRWE